MFGFTDNATDELRLLTTHPMATSRLLYSLLQLVKKIEIASNDNPLNQLIDSSILGHLLSAICYRDPETLRHSRRVGLISLGIGSRLGWEEEELQLIEIASLLHDIGKIGIPDHILHKPGRLTPDESEFIAAYHRVSVDFLQVCRANEELVRIIAQSHGVDLPARGKQEQEICLGARILAVADAYESLTTPKPYRKAHTDVETLKILQEQSGKDFDRNVVAALGRWLHSPDSGVLKNRDAADAAIQASMPNSDIRKARAVHVCQLIQYMHLLDSIYDGFYVIDESRRIVIWSLGNSRLFGFSAKDIVGQPWHRSVVGGTASKPDPIETAIKDQHPICHGISTKDSKGGTRELGVQTVPVFDNDGLVIGVAELICNGQESKRNSGQFRRLQMAATRDALTGVTNRGELDEQIQQVYTKWKSEPTIPFSLVFFDIDHFKPINDRLSHAVGDRVLIDVARLVQDELYSGEVIGRYGGEEFVILCPETDLQAACERAERIRRAIMGGRFADREDLRITASFGVAQAEPGDTPESLLKRADLALYDAKHQGRNRTCYRATRRANTPQDDQNAKDHPWIHDAEIVTCVASSMLMIKLKGYVIDKNAKIVDVKEDRLQLHVGTPGLLGGWGKKPEKQPVQLKIHIEELPFDAKQAATRRLLLKTRAEPIGRPAAPEIFQTRATIVIEELRAYLMAD